VFTLCSDDKHSDSQSERHRHVRVILHVDDGYGRGGRNSHATWQRLGPVRLSYLAHSRSALVFSSDVNLRNSCHRTGALLRCRLSSLVQRKNEQRFGCNSA